MPDSAQSIKARLFPLTPVEYRLEWLIERLPRTRIAIDLTPHTDLHPLDPDRQEYKADGENASFKFSPLPSGWYYLEAAITRHNGDRTARIHGVTLIGQIFDIPIPSNLRGTVREVFHLPEQVTEIYWQPTATAGFFSQSDLLIHKISSLESVLRRGFRVFTELWKHRHSPPEERGGLTLGNALFNHQFAYLQTAYFQLQRYKGKDYPTFIKRQEKLTPAALDAMRTQFPTFQRRYDFSLIVVIDQPNPPWLSHCIESIQNQIYPTWELFIVSAEQPHSTIRHPRIHWLTEGNASHATRFNRALALAKGDFMAEISPYDTLAPHALFVVAQHLQHHPESTWIYSDHDEIDETGQRTRPCFKPDWNPDLFTAYPYIGNLCLHQTKAIQQLGGYRNEYAGAEAYDLCLRVLNKSIQTITHLPQVFYHQRATPWTDEKTTHSSGKTALRNFFLDTNIKVNDGIFPGSWHIQHPIPALPPLVSLLIPTRDKAEILAKCITSIQQKTSYPNWEILVIDNQSTEDNAQSYLTQLTNDPRIRVLTYNHPFNYSAINNFAASQANGEILVLLNNDTEIITPEWLTELVRHAIRPDIGAVGAKLLYSNGLVQHAGVVLGIGGVAGHVHKYLNDDDHGYCHRANLTQNYSAVTAACLAVQKTKFHQVDGLDENLRVALNDVDFCIKLLQTGYRNLYTPHAKLYHHESLSRGHDDTPEKMQIFKQEFEYMKEKWGKLLNQDNSYNQNMTRQSEDFSVQN